VVVDLAGVVRVVVVVAVGGAGVGRVGGGEPERRLVDGTLDVAGFEAVRGLPAAVVQ
jgi:hypothetical protein